MGRQLFKARRPPLAAALEQGGWGRPSRKPDPATFTGGPSPWALARNTRARRGGLLSVASAPTVPTGKLPGCGWCLRRDLPSEAWSGSLLAPGRTTPSEARHEMPLLAEKHGQRSWARTSPWQLIAIARLAGDSGPGKPWQPLPNGAAGAWGSGERGYGPLSATGS